VTWFDSRRVNHNRCLRYRRLLFLIPSPPKSYDPIFTAAGQLIIHHTDNWKDDLFEHVDNEDPGPIEAVMDIVLARLLRLLEALDYRIHFSTSAWKLYLRTCFLYTNGEVMREEQWLAFNAKSYRMWTEALDLCDYEDEFVRLL
jgi:hypothetical protein